MKKLIALLVALVCSLSVAPQLYAWEISFDNYIGGAIYKESESSVESDWSAFYNKSTVKVADYDNKNVEGDLHFGMGVSATGEETWDINGVEFQRNDMRFWDIDTGIDLGWAFSFPVGEETNVTLTPLVGYRWRFIRFTRENFTILNVITIRETIDEDYNIHFLDVGGRFSVTPGEKLEFFAKPVFGIVLYNSADNSELGTIEGDGGFAFSLDTGINYAIKENIILGLMFSCEIQRLTGGESGNVLWPDNSLDTYGGKISLSYRF